MPMWSTAGHRPARGSGFRLFGQSVFCCDHRMPLTRSIKTEMYLVYSSGDQEVQSMVPYWSEGHVSTCLKGCLLRGPFSSCKVINAAIMDPT